MGNKTLPGPGALFPHGSRGLLLSVSRGTSELFHRLQRALLFARACIGQPVHHVGPSDLRKCRAPSGDYLGALLSCDL